MPGYRCLHGEVKEGANSDTRMELRLDLDHPSSKNKHFVPRFTAVKLPVVTFWLLLLPARFKLGIIVINNQYLQALFFGGGGGRYVLDGKSETEWEVYPVWYFVIGRTHSDTCMR